MIIKDQQKQTGFTLIEVLVAISIFAFVAAISYSSLNNALIVREKTGKFNQELSNLQLAIQILDKDFRQISDRPILNPSGGNITQPSLSIGGNNNIIEFTHTGWPNPLQHTRSELQRVAYLIEDEKLIREYWLNLDRTNNAEAIRTVLLSNVEEFKVKVLTADNVPQSVWPPNSSNAAALPLAIELTLETPLWGSIRRVYEIIQ